MTDTSSASLPPAAALAPADANSAFASGATATYVNFCRVTGTPEEIIIDFALVGDEAGGRDWPLTARPRLAFNVYTAKRLLQTLQAAISRHESTFGAVELDVDKRLGGPSA